MFRIGIIIVMLLLAGIIFYLWTRLRRFAFVRKLKEKKWQYRVLAAVYILVLLAALALQMVNTAIVLLHLAFFWAVGDWISWLVKKLSKKQWERYYAGGLALLVTVLYLGVGWYNAHHVVETHYTVHTDKDLGGQGLRILQITDMHIGATFDGDEFAEYAKEAEKCSPDIVVATGDFVDEGTSREDMIKSCKALGGISSVYGVYFIYGNHDKGNYTSSREFTRDELRDELEKNNIVILEDDTVLIDDRFYLIGRSDKSEEFYGGRSDMSELVEGLDQEKFMLVLDHQPNDYDNQRKAEVDLVLSGHTHGGHIFPAGPVGDAFKINDMTYGIRTEGNTTFEVSSGISGWEIVFKTFAISEYVVIDVEE